MNNVKYSVSDFKERADFGAASTHGKQYCEDCLYRRGMHCGNPLLLVRFSLGTHPERMGCRNFFCPK